MDRLIPAIELADQNGTRYPNESEDYRCARTALLAEEIELRRHIERVAPELAPLWTIIDSTPEGRAPTWYPKLNY